MNFCNKERSCISFLNAVDIKSTERKSVSISATAHLKIINSGQKYYLILATNRKKEIIYFLARIKYNVFPN